MRTRPELLTTPTIPTELEYVSPREVLGKSWWDKERKVVEEMTSGCCQVCGTHKTKAWYRKYLEGHEICHVDNDIGHLVLDEVVVLCHSCHQFIHVGTLVRNYHEEIIGESYLTNVLTHGVSILSYANLKPTSVQGIHWLMFVKGYDKNRAIEYVVKSHMATPRQEINMNREWKLEYNGDIHI